MNKTTFHRAIATLAFALLACVCWVAAGMVSDRMVQQELATSVRVEQQMAASIVDNTAQIIASDLAMSRAIPATIAEMDMIQLALAQSHSSAEEIRQTEPERRAKLLAVPALAKLDNVVLTPHIASGTLVTRMAMADLAFNNLEAHFSGKPVLTPVPA